MNSKTKGQLAIILATFLYGFYGIFARLLENSLDLFYQFWVRDFLLALVVLAPVILSGSWKKIDRKSWKWFFLRALAGIIGSVPIFIAFNHLEIGATLFIFYAGTLIGGYAIGKFIFKERITFEKIFAFFLAFLGLYLIYSVNIASNKFFFMAITFIDGAASSAWYAFSKKVSDKFSYSQIIFVDSVLAGAVLMVASIFLRENWTMPAINFTWLYNLLFTGMFLGVGYLIVYGFKRIEAQIGSLLMLAEVIFAIVLGYLFFGEMIGALTLVGGAMIIFAIILPEIKFFRKLHRVDKKTNR